MKNKNEERVKDNEQMITKTNEKVKNGDESEVAPIRNAKREPFDPLAPAHVIEIVDKAMRELYDPYRSPEGGRLDVRCTINRACEEAFRKALRLSKNELAKQLADAQEERDGMLILWGSGGALDLESGTRLRQRISTFQQALAMTDKMIEESIIGRRA